MSGLGLSEIEEAINPYLLYAKITAVIILVSGIFFAGIWIRGVCAERDALKQSKLGPVVVRIIISSPCPGTV